MYKGDHVVVSDSYRIRTDLYEFDFEGSCVVLILLELFLKTSLPYFEVYKPSFFLT